MVGWRAGAVVGYLEDGSKDRRWVSGKTQAEVREKLETLKTARNGGMLAAHGVPTVAKLLTLWLEHTESRGRARNTLKAYQRVVDAHLTPKLGKLRLDKLTVLDCERCVSSVQKGHGAGEAKRTLSYLRTALKQAVRWQLVPRNVGDAVTMPQVTRSSADAWIPSEVLRFLEVAAHHRLSTLFHVALSLGLRSGELRGLRWADLDFKQGWLEVAQNAIGEGGKVTLSPMLKTDASKRKIKLDPVTLEHLETHRAAQGDEREQAEGAYQDMGLVFASQVGTPLCATNLRRTFNSLIKLAGVRRIRIHDMRHTAATAMIRHGYPPKLVSDILGHTDPAFTLKTYAHIWDEQREEYAPSVRSLYGSQDRNAGLN